MAETGDPKPDLVEVAAGESAMSKPVALEATAGTVLDSLAGGDGQVIVLPSLDRSWWLAGHLVISGQPALETGAAARTRSIVRPQRDRTASRSGRSKLIPLVIFA